MVSVIIPTYNREKLLGRAVQSILRQTYQYFEIIIVDDGSTDHTEEIVEQMADARIHYIRLEQNQGVSHARNVGIKAAQYDYIAFLDSDDEWLPSKLEQQMNKFAESSDETGMVFCRMRCNWRNGRGISLMPSEDYTKEILEGDLFNALLLRNVIGTPSILVRRKYLEQTGGFHETLQCLEDWELVLRLADVCLIGFVDEVLVEVHKTEGSISANIGGYFLSRHYIISRYREHMKALGILDRVENDMLMMGKRCGLYEEVKELLKCDTLLK